VKPQALPASVLVREATWLGEERTAMAEAIDLVRQWESLDATYRSAKSGTVSDEVLRSLYRVTESVRNRLTDIKSTLLDPTAWIEMWQLAGEANAAKFASAGADAARFTSTRSGRPVYLPRGKAVKLIDKALDQMAPRVLIDLAPYAPPEE
jgi:hypothetical protein